MEVTQSQTEERNFVEFRRKVRAREVLSAAMERLLTSLHFTGRVSIVLQNGRVLKSGYEERYFPNFRPCGNARPQVDLDVLRERIARHGSRKGLAMVKATTGSREGRKSGGVEVSV